MKRLSLHLLLSALLLTSAAAVATAQQAETPDVPRTISYQGFLSTNDGTPLPNGTYDITVALYADEAGTTPIWKSTYKTSVHNGIFNLYLGTGNTPLPSSQQMNRPLWVGTSVNGSNQMLPLTPLTSSPYALNLPDKAVTTGKLADGSVTAEKMGTPYVAGIALNGKTITADGTVLNIEVGDGIALTYDEVTKTLRLSHPAIAVQGDAEKAASVQDWMGNASQNWIGRDAAFAGAANVPFYDVPNAGTSTYNTLVGGYKNVTRDDSHFNFIGGGRENAIEGDYNFIGGGGGTTVVVYSGAKDTNAIHKSDYGVIGGGRGNLIDTSAHDATIGGGVGNWIFANNFSDGVIPNESGATIGGGGGNVARGYYATISGGHHNLASGDLAFIGGGGDNVHNNGSNAANQATALYTVVTGGHNNRSTSDYAFLGGGENNRAGGEYGVIGGGDSNIIWTSADHGVIAGGRNNQIIPTGGAIVGGDLNLLDSSSIWSFIGGGQYNTIKHGGWAVISGGINNRITASSGGGSNNSAIGGGENHYISAISAVIAGGNKDTVTGIYSGILSGHENKVSGYSGTIGGGYNNKVEALEGFIGAGSGNLITVDADHSVIGGGAGNEVEAGAEYGTIGGGAGNTIKVPAGALDTRTLATIPGGDGLIAQSWAQTVMGAWNVAKGSVPFRYSGSYNKNNPIVIVGSGANDANRANAFEVSYNGHSIVYDENGTGAARGAARGATYQDNIVYAWGSIGLSGNRICNDFGVEKVFRIGVGRYRIELNPVKETGSQADSTVDFSCASVTATISSGQSYDGSAHGECKFITTSLIGANNIFDVYITENWITPQGQLSCRSVDAAFTFKVTGRLQDRP